MDRPRLRWWILLLVGLAPGLPVLGQQPLVLTFAGDLMAHGKNQSMPRYDDIYRRVSSLLSADDWSFVNLETPLDAGRPRSDYPRFNAHPEYAAAALRGGFDVFSLANNHSNDFGLASVKGTLNAMDTLAATWPFYWSGLKNPGQPAEPIVLEKRGWRMGFVALTNLLNQEPGRSGVNAVRLWEPWSGREDSAEAETLLEQIRLWKTRVPFLIVSLHDGVEYSSVPHRFQVAFYQRMIEAGVDILWGHHPHVLQPWAWVETPRGRRLILFSMGNFISRQTGNLGPADGARPRARTGDTALLQVRLLGTPAGPAIQSATPILLANYHHPNEGMVVVPIDTLLSEADPRWQPFFRHRKTVLERWKVPLKYPLPAPAR